MRSSTLVVLFIATAAASPRHGTSSAILLRGGARPTFEVLRGGGRKGKELEELPPKPPVIAKPKSGGVPLAVTVFIAVALWIGVATVYYAKCEAWPLAQSFFYAVDTGMSIGFGTVAEQKLSTKLFTIAHVLMGASAVGGAIALFAESAVAGSTAIANAEYTIASVRAAFNAADADKSGSLSHSELAKVLTKQCPYLSKAELQRAIDAFDNDGDGQVTIDEFVSAVGKYVDGETSVDEAYAYIHMRTHAYTCIHTSTYT